LYILYFAAFGVSDHLAKLRAHGIGIFEEITQACYTIGKAEL
jgi:hypothetical protein